MLEGPNPGEKKRCETQEVIRNRKFENLAMEIFG